MQGNGSADEPYIVTNFYDLFGACSQEDAYVKLDADLDGSEYNDGVWDKPIIINMVMLDGQGHTIKNILDNDGNGILDQQQTEKTCTIKNLNFESIVSQNSCFVMTDSTIHSYVHNKFPIIFENCTFSLDVKTLSRHKTNNDYSSNSAKVNFIRCSFDYTQDLLEFNWFEMQFCNVHVNLRSVSTTADYQLFSCVIYSRVEINILQKCNKILRCSAFLGCSVSVTDSEGTSEIKWIFPGDNTGVSCGLINIFNISGIKSTNYNTGNGLKDGVAYIGGVFLNEEHIKSSEYLNKIGFPVAVE